jgi:N-acetylneuraminate synthase
MKNELMLIAEISGNHLGSFERAKELITAAKSNGATHVKLQTYTPDTLTLNVSTQDFRVMDGHSLWSGRTLYDLYTEAQTPWEWHKDLFKYASEIGATIFSTPFDPTAVELLESLNTPLYKIASLETNDIPLIRLVAETGKPLIVSTGATTLEEIDEVVETVAATGNKQLTLLLCTSAYPTPIYGVNLKRLGILQNRYGLPVGLSDHTLELEASLGAISLGATVIERHLTLSRADGGADSAFSLEPHEFKNLSISMQKTLAALGESNWDVNPLESESRRFRRSLYITKKVTKGEIVNFENVRSVRPGYGIAPKHLQEITGKKFLQDIPAGTALQWNHFE